MEKRWSIFGLNELGKLDVYFFESLFGNCDVTLWQKAPIRVLNYALIVLGIGV